LIPKVSIWGWQGGSFTSRAGHLQVRIEAMAKNQTQLNKHLLKGFYQTSILLKCQTKEKIKFYFFKKFPDFA
jgi:hypothetical protein